MRIFLTGATGFIGNAVLFRAVEQGHRVTCLVRPGKAATITRLGLPGVEAVEGQFTEVASWSEALAEHDVVVNCVGIIREVGPSTFDAVHARAPIALFDAAKSHGLDKIIQVSALGADENAESEYHKSKREADRHLAELGVPFVVLRPSFVFGPSDHSMTFFQSLAALPVTLVPGDGQYLVQPVHIDDLTRAVVHSIEHDMPTNLVVDLGGREAITFDGLLDTLARQLGKASARKVHVPEWLMRGVARTTDMLGGRGPITSEELGMLLRGNHASIAPFVEAFGFEPMPFEVGLARTPLREADVWHSYLTHLRIPLRLCVAFIWIITGIVSAFFSVEMGYDLLRQIGIEGSLASVALFGTAYFEIAIGIATAVGYRVRLMAILQLVLMFGFTGILTWKLPELWLHPFGPLTKNVPIVGATLAMMALEE